MTQQVEPPCMTAQAVNVWYRGFQALKDITFTVAPRRVTALIGPSGKAGLFTNLDLAGDGKSGRPARQRDWTSDAD